jgi:hypothetical protein
LTLSLALKLLLTPLLVVVASLAARRWGSQVAGWLVGFPLTSAPVAVILTLDHGPRFTAAAAAGILLGVVSQAAFAVSYIWAARRLPWAACLVVATLAFAMCTAAFAHLNVPALADAALAAAVLSGALALVPLQAKVHAATRPPRWDLPARVAVATVFVFAVTGIAPYVGPALTGLVTPFPLYATVLGVFAHLHDGASSASEVMRGLLVGLYGFGAFFLALAMLAVPAGPPAAFAVAVFAVFGVQLIALRILRRGQPV